MPTTSAPAAMTKPALVIETNGREANAASTASTNGKERREAPDDGGG